MSRIEASATVLVNADPDLVRRHFGDVAHHASTGVHRGTRFEVLEDDGRLCRYRQVTRVGPLRLAQELELERTADGPLVNMITAGQFRGGSISFRITPSQDASQATVLAELSGPVRGLQRLAAPLLRRKVIAALRFALDEDKADIESGSYQA